MFNGPRQEIQRHEELKTGEKDKSATDGCTFKLKTLASK